MSLLANTLVIGVAVALALWVAGGVLLRGCGIAVVLLGLGAALAHPVALLLVIPGTALWAVGHWHYALRHHTYKSPLVERVFLQLLPGPCDPTRRWHQTNKDNNHA